MAHNSNAGSQSLPRVCLLWHTGQCHQQICFWYRSIFGKKTNKIESLVTKLSQINPGELEHLDEEEDFLTKTIVIRDGFNDDSLNIEEKSDDEDEGCNAHESVTLVTEMQKIDILLKGFDDNDDDVKSGNVDDGEFKIEQENDASEVNDLEKGQGNAEGKKNFKKTHAFQKV